MNFYTNSRGENIVLNYIYRLPSEDKVMILRALKGLSDGNSNSSAVLNIKKWRHPIWELTVGKYRIFYQIKNNDLFILHCCRKQSSKTSKVDTNLILNRSKNL